MNIRERLSRDEDRCDSETIDRLCGLDWLFLSEARGIFYGLEDKHAPQRILSRNHATHNPYVIGHYDTPEPLVYAAPWFTAESALPHRYMSQEVYKDFPSDIAFVSFFLAHPQQTYFPDDTLEEVLSKKRQCEGKILGPEDDVVSHIHFETNICPQNNPKFTTLLFHSRFPEPQFFAEINEQLEVWLNSRLCFSDKARKNLTRAVFKPEAKTL